MMVTIVISIFQAMAVAVAMVMMAARTVMVVAAMVTCQLQQ